MRCDPPSQTSRTQAWPSRFPLTQKGRLRLVTQHLQHSLSLSLKELSAENIVSLRSAYGWLPCHRSGGSVSLADRPSMRLTQRRKLEQQQLQHAVDLRH